MKLNLNSIGKVKRKEVMHCINQGVLKSMNDLNTNKFLIIVSCISVKLESESGNELVAHALHFYSAQKIRHLNQISRTY